MNSPLPSRFCTSFSLCVVFGLIPSLQAARPIPDEYRIGGFAVGPQAGCFKNFSVYEAIDKAAKTGAKVIEFSHRLKKLDPNRPHVVFDYTLSPVEIRRVRQKLKEHGLLAVNYGAVPIPRDEAGARKIFEFAKNLGLYAIITESVESIAIIEKLAREYDIKVGFHNHARRDNPEYKLWDPHYVRSLVENRDPHLGACADVGHWQTSGIKAMDGLRTLEGRIVSVHLKDRPALGTGQHDVPFGTGATDIGAVLAELRRQHFDGNIAIEYEYNWDDSVPDVAQCVGFVRGWTAANPP